MEASIESASLNWSEQFLVGSANNKLQGDRITLPQSALEALLAAAPIVAVSNGSSQTSFPPFDPYNAHIFAAEAEARHMLGDRQQQLPHPLTFRLVNPKNGRVAYCGIREFSAQENEVGLSTVLRGTLGIDADSSYPSQSPSPDGEDSGTTPPEPPRIRVHAKQLPKGTYVRLRPLEAGYDEDWKSLLERYLRDNFTTLTKGEILSVSTRRQQSFQFLVDKVEPTGDAICIVDTDLEVDIEALNEEQARETLKRKLAKTQHEPGTPSGSSRGGDLSISHEKSGQVLPGDYIDYEINTAGWREHELTIELESGQEEAELDLLISPFSAIQRARPRNHEYVWADFSSLRSKRIRLSRSDNCIENAEAIYVSVHANRQGNDVSPAPLPFLLRSELSEPQTNDIELNESDDLSPDEGLCKNCQQKIPKRTMPLHEAFCYRNNVSRPKCHQVFLRSSPSWKAHWHCPHDAAYGDTSHGRDKHNTIFHPDGGVSCPNCNFQTGSFPALAKHRTSSCPGKEILCQFCHLIVPQQGPDDPSFADAEVLLSGLTPHELTDGGRTTECHICSKIVRLRDLKTHLMLHDRDRVARHRPTICKNSVCGRAIKDDDIVNGQERLGLCNECFGPLYVANYDPEGKALRRRIERRLLQQLMTGCGKKWCHNAEFCRSGRKNLTGQDQGTTAKDALPRVKSLLEASDHDKPLFFCVDESTQKKRDIALTMAELREYEVEWWAKALEETRGGGKEPAEAQARRGREWLEPRAPRIGEVVR